MVLGGVGVGGMPWMGGGVGGGGVGVREMRGGERWWEGGGMVVC